MPILNLESPVFISVDGAGRPNAGGTVGVYVAGTSFATPATIYSDQLRTTELANPVTMDAAGTKEIWYDVKVDIQEKTNAGVLIRDTLNLDPNATATASTSFNLAQNGSFEVDANSDDEPDNWTISPYSGSTIAITQDVVTNGLNALEFNTTAAGGGGGVATSAKFPVTEGSNCHVEWSFFATHATTLNLFQIKWYDEADILQSTSTLTMPASGAVPVSWTNYSEDVTAAAGATQGEIVLTGISSGGSNLNSKAYFDGISIINMPVVTLTNAQTLTNKTLTSPTITSPDIDQVVDSNGSEIAIFTSEANSVNEITFSAAATGNLPSINQTGEDVGLTVEGVTIHNGAITGTSIDVTGDVEGTSLTINGAAATNRLLGIKTAGVLRWYFGGDDAAEAGANAGSDVVLYNYTDGGVFIGTPIRVIRSTGLCTITNLDPSSAGTAISGQSAGDLGTYCFARGSTSNIAFGATIAGSSLLPASAITGLTQTTGSYIDGALTTGSALSGTWQCMGYYDYTAAAGTGNVLYGSTLWVKVAS